MGRIVGIDLGTTYSAVAIPEERTGEGFAVVPGCPGCSVILDKLKRRITPSVVAEDSTGQIVVGYGAKNRAGLFPEPIMFAKRAMGDDKTFQLARQGALRPEEVAAHVLRYLKAMAEERLGEPVDEAVITVPAYFSLRAKQMTEKAGELAGLKVAQVAPEPVAAALMYCAGDPRESLRIMTYDLGGGTFDVAILEKRDGTISTDSIIAFDGDRFLGGYNFDKKLALWIMDQLVAKGYDLTLNLDAPADSAIFAKLMIHAERAKIDLSKVESYTIQDVNSGILDHAGNAVAIEDLTITRAAFEAMITPEIDETIALCHRARTEKASRLIEKHQFDEILMVGGSSYIPLVARRLAEEFGRTPKLIEPNLCVALGAAILAGTQLGSFGRLKLNPIPTETDLPSLTVGGQVVPGEGLPVVDGSTVTLRAMDASSTARRTVGADGRFAFDRVPLAPEATTEFVLTVASRQAVDVASHRFAVKHSQSAAGAGPIQPVTNMLAKPIGIVTVDGVHIVAKERTPLTYETVTRAKTSDTSGQIRIPIVEEHSPLGEIVMTDIPTTLPVGTVLEITLTIQENYQIRGRAIVPAIGREALVTINIPIPVRKTPEELRDEYEVLAAQAKDALGGAGRGALFGDARAKRLTDRLAAAAEMLQSRGAEPAMIQECLDEIRSLVQAIGAGWRPEPPKAVFEQRAGEAEALLARAIKAKPKVAEEGYDHQLAAIRNEAEQAYTGQNTASWKEAFSRVVALCERLEAVVPQTGGDGETNPAALLLALARELSALERTARNQGRYPAFRADFESLAKDLQAIDPKGANAMSQFRDWYLTKLADLRKRLHAPMASGLTQVEDDIGYVHRAAFQLEFSYPDALRREDPRTEGRSQRQGTPEVPHEVVDRVTFSVTAPVGLLPGNSFSLDVWAHLKKQRQAVIQQAREAAAGGEILVKSKGPVQVARGTVLFVRLDLEGLHVENSEDTILWDGDIGNATFSASVPRVAAEGPRKGLARIYADALEIVRVDFTLHVGRVTAEVDEIRTTQSRHRNAFASYASADRDVVLLLVQGIEKAGVQVFLDVLSLRSGQRWENELWQRIPRSDVFYLFWSENARRSDWVEREWRCALETRGLDFIDPVPLASPDEVPPPPELASKHFNDWTLAFRRGMGRQSPPA